MYVSSDVGKASDVINNGNSSSGQDIEAMLNSLVSTEGESSSYEAELEEKEGMVLIIGVACSVVFLLVIILIACSIYN